MQLEFLDFRVDTDTGEIWRRGRRLPVERKVVDFIACLAAHAGEVVTRDAILREVWPDSATTLGSISRATSLARNALDDRSRGVGAARIIETIRGTGYRLNAAVRRVASVQTMAETTLGDRAEERRSRLFVGRRKELDRLMALLGSDGASIVYVWGPGGIGKSELLAAFARGCRERGTSVHWVDGGQVTSAEQLEAAAATSGILMIDAFEQLGALQAHLWQRVLPREAESKRILIAGREDPSTGVDPRWRSLAEAVQLENLGPAESDAALERLAVPTEHHGAIYSSTYGHPLALALVGDLVANDPSRVPDLHAHPDIVQSLLGQFLRELPDAEARRALWCGALVRTLSESLLRSMLGDPAGQQFDWLRGLSFMRSYSGGQAPHEIVRAALLADIEWREPGARRELLVRAIDHYVARAERDPSRAHEIVPAFAHVYRGELGFDSPGPEFYMTPALEEDEPAIESMILGHEGTDSVGWFRREWEAGAEVDVLRDASDEPAGFLMGLFPSDISRGEAVTDPGLAPLVSRLRSNGQLDGHRVYYIRFWMARDGYHEGPAAEALMDAISGKALRHDPDLGCFCHEDPSGMVAFSRGAAEDWDCDFQSGRRTLGVVGIDYRQTSPLQWNRRALDDLLGLSGGVDIRDS